MSGSHTSTRSPSAVSRAGLCSFGSSAGPHPSPTWEVLRLARGENKPNVPRCSNSILLAAILLISFPIATLGSKMWSFQERMHLNFVWEEERGVVIKWYPGLVILPRSANSLAIRLLMLSSEAYKAAIGSAFNRKSIHREKPCVSWVKGYLIS